MSEGRDTRRDSVPDGPGGGPGVGDAPRNEGRAAPARVFDGAYARELVRGITLPVLLVFALGFIIDQDEQHTELLSPGVCKADWVGDTGMTLLQVAALFNDAKMAEALLDRGCDVNGREFYHQDSTALHVAAGFGGAEVIDTLVSRGADISAEGDWSYYLHSSPPLHWALYLGNTEGMLALLGDDPDTMPLLDGMFSEPEGLTPLHFLASSEENTVGAASVLIERGADVMARGGGSDSTPLHLAAANNNVGIMRLLIESGASIDALNAYRNTPLGNAATLGNVEAARLLIDYGADPSKETVTAARYGREDVMLELIHEGADVNAPNSRTGMTPLHTAALAFEWTKPGEMTRFLVERGADAKALVSDVGTPFIVESIYGGSLVVDARVYVLEEIHVKDPQITDDYRKPTIDGFSPMHFAALNPDPGPISVLIEQGAGIEAKTPTSDKPLHLAAAFGRVINASMLLEAGADPSAPDGLGNQPIHLAAKIGGAGVMHALIDHGADLSSRDGEGNAPIHLAAKASGIDRLRVLLKSGADIEERGREGFTALHFAARHGNPGVVVELLDAGATADAFTADGKTPFELAGENDRLQGTDALKRLEAALESSSADGGLALR